jgi:pyruvate dehydrogenase E2 component (dihydrolipoamide acetyltransferase)
LAVDVVMPRLSDSMEEGTILTWLVAEGEEVRSGEPLVEIETDKATVTYEAETDGVLLRIVRQEGETAALGERIAIIGAPGEVVDVAPDPPSGATAAPAVGGTDAPPAAPAAPSGNGRAARPGRVAASPVARRIARALGVDLARVTGTGPNGRIVRADVEAAAQAMAAAGAATAPPAGRPAPAADAPARPAPAVDRPGTGAPAPPAPPPAPAAAGAGARGAGTVQELTRLQRTVARRMAESRATVPAFELRVDVDMSACVELRERLRAIGADPLPTYTDLIVKASALALREHPRVNGSYTGDTFTLHERVNVGVAVAAADALLVPTVFDADRRSLGDIARTTRALADRARDGSITPAELDGATFTVSNLGMYGIDSFTAIVDMPQAAILAVGALRPRPVVDEEGGVVARPSLALTLACDHRILYGADGAAFLARVRELLEEPLAFVL